MRVELSKELIEKETTPGISIKKLAAKLGVCEKVLSREIRRHGIMLESEKIKNRVVSEIPIFHIIQMSFDHTLKEIHDATGVSVWMIQKVLRDAGVLTKLNSRKNYLSSIDFNEVKAMQDAGMSFSDIGKKYGVRLNTVLSWFSRGTTNCHPARRGSSKVGRRYGAFVILEYLGIHDGSRSYLCKCDCGNVVVRSGRFRTDNPNCGCKDVQNRKNSLNTKLEDLTGRVFGKLTVIRAWDSGKTIGRGREKIILGECRCQCGNVEIRKMHILTDKSMCSDCRRDCCSSRAIEKTGYTKYHWYFLNQGKKINCRSSFEVIYANYLMRSGINFQYEPKIFVLGPALRYLPDFFIPELNLYVELKGFDCSKGIQKRDAFIKKGFQLKTLFWKDIVRETGLWTSNFYHIGTSANKLGVSREDFLGKGMYYALSQT